MPPRTIIDVLQILLNLPEAHGALARGLSPLLFTSLMALAATCRRLHTMNHEHFLQFVPHAGAVRFQPSSTLRDPTKLTRDERWRQREWWSRLTYAAVVLEVLYARFVLLHQSSMSEHRYRGYELDDDVHEAVKLYRVHQMLHAIGVRTDLFEHYSEDLLERTRRPQALNQVCYTFRKFKFEACVRRRLARLLGSDTLHILVDTIPYRKFLGTINVGGPCSGIVITSYDPDIPSLSEMTHDHHRQFSVLLDTYVTELEALQRFFASSVTPQAQERYPVAFDESIQRLRNLQLLEATDDCEEQHDVRSIALEVDPVDYRQAHGAIQNIRSSALDQYALPSSYQFAVPKHNATFFYDTRMFTNLCSLEQCAQNFLQGTHSATITMACIDKTCSSYT